MPRRSGRYPWGSGDRPYQSNDQISNKDIRKALRGKERPDSFRRSHTIPSGTKMYRTTSNPNEQNDQETYVTYFGPDRDFYKSGYIKSRDKTDKVYESTFSLKNEIKVAGRDEIKKSVNTLMENRPDLVQESVEAWLDHMIPEGSLNRYYIEEQSQGGWENFVEDTVKNVSNKQIDDAYSMLVQSLGESPNMRKEIVSDLKKKGYDAMSDEAGIGRLEKDYPIEGIEPLIIFEPDKTMFKEETKEIKPSEAYSSANRFNKWKTKADFRSNLKSW